MLMCLQNASRKHDCVESSIWEAIQTYPEIRRDKLQGSKILWLLQRCRNNFWPLWVRIFICNRASTITWTFTFLFNCFKILLYSMINNSISVRLYFSVSISGAESPKAPAPLGMESGAILTHRLPLPPCLIINMPHRMLDYISKGPKTRLDMLAGQLEWKTPTKGCKWIFSRPQGQ